MICECFSVSVSPFQDLLFESWISNHSKVIKESKFQRIGITWSSNSLQTQQLDFGCPENYRKHLAAFILDVRCRAWSSYYQSFGACCKSTLARGPGRVDSARGEMSNGKDISIITGMEIEDWMTVELCGRSSGRRLQAAAHASSRSVESKAMMRPKMDSALTQVTYTS